MKLGIKAKEGKGGTRKSHLESLALGDDGTFRKDWLMGDRSGLEALILEPEAVGGRPQRKPNE